MVFRERMEVYVSKDATESPLVLVLEVAAIAELIHSYSQGVLAGLVDLRGDIEFGRIASAL